MKIKILVPLLALSACISSSLAGSLPDPATDVIDEELMVALGQAKNFHRKAKVYMSDGNLPAATASVRQIGEYIAVLRKGRIVQSGAADEMWESSNPFVRQFLNRGLIGPLGME